MRLKTHSEFVKEIYDLVGDEYTVLDEYVKSNVRIKMRHNKCGHIYEVIPQNFLYGTRCPNCSKKGRKKREKNRSKNKARKI